MKSDLSQPLELFYCYARKDRVLRDELHIHLASLHKSGLITTWYDGEIVAGTHREQEIERHLEAAHVILLLVSPDFIASESCYSKEMERAIERHHRKEARVIPVLLRPAYWTDAPFSKLQMLPSDCVPVTRWSDRDEAFADVVKGICWAVNDLHSQQVPNITPSMQGASPKITGTIDGLSPTILSLPEVKAPSEGTVGETTQNKEEKTMKQEETSCICEYCGTRNTFEYVFCRGCGMGRKTNATRLLPETQSALETGPVSGSQRSSVPRFPSLTLTVQRASNFIKRGKRWVILLSILMVIIILSPIFVPRAINHFLCMVSPIGPDGIGVTSVDGECIGISDGRYAFDTNRSAGSYMLQASESLRNGNLSSAVTGWKAAHEKDTNDAEPLIYVENQRVLTSGTPYITVVLGVSLGVKVLDGYSRDALQAAYVVQKACNEDPQLSGGKKLRLLIANSGSGSNHSKDIASQIVKAAQYDKTIVGVQGWTTSVTTLNALSTLVQAHLPIVASDIASDTLKGISPYFFRIENRIELNIPLAITYIKKQQAHQRLIIFRNPKDLYSVEASDSFTQQYNKDGYRIAATEDFQTGNETALTQLVQSALEQYHPNLVYIPTTTVDDITTLLKAIPSTAEYANLKVLTGVEGYELVQPGMTFPDGYTRMLMSSSAFPDEWAMQALGHQEPPFFKDYIAAYDPHDQHMSDPYTYRRANAETMMGYDALFLFLVANKHAIQQGKQNPTGEDIQKALAQINGSQSFQGITGVISFGADHDPINRLHFVLHVVDGGYTRVAAYQGCLLVNSAECNNDIHILE